jgi:hypothetical protein
MTRLPIRAFIVTLQIVFCFTLSHPNDANYIRDSQLVVLNSDTLPSLKKVRDILTTDQPR